MPVIKHKYTSSWPRWLIFPHASMSRICLHFPPAKTNKSGAAGNKRESKWDRSIVLRVFRGRCWIAESNHSSLPSAREIKPAFCAQASYGRRVRKVVHLLSRTEDDVVVSASCINVLRGEMIQFQTGSQGGKGYDSCRCSFFFFFSRPGQSAADLRNV